MEDIVSRLKALADILDRYWSYDSPRTGVTLATISGTMKLPSTMWKDSAFRRVPSTFLVGGVLIGGQMRQQGVATQAGFTLQAWSEIASGLDPVLEPTDFFYEREYPCAHVPMPWAEDVQDRMVYFTQSSHVLMMLALDDA